MRLDEPEQVDMVLGDGARDRGATCELISPDPATGAGVAFVRLEADPDPVRVRAGWISDADIQAMACQCAQDTRPLELEGCRDDRDHHVADRLAVPGLRNRTDHARRRHIPDPGGMPTVRLGG